MLGFHTSHKRLPSCPVATSDEWKAALSQMTAARVGREGSRKRMKGISNLVSGGTSVNGRGVSTPLRMTTRSSSSPSSSNSSSKDEACTGVRGLTLNIDAWASSAVMLLRKLGVTGRGRASVRIELSSKLKSSGSRSANAT